MPPEMPLSLSLFLDYINMRPELANLLRFSGYVPKTGDCNFNLNL